IGSLGEVEVPGARPGVVGSARAGKRDVRAPTARGHEILAVVHVLLLVDDVRGARRAGDKRDAGERDRCKSNAMVAAVVVHVPSVSRLSLPRGAGVRKARRLSGASRSCSLVPSDRRTMLIRTSECCRQSWTRATGP